MLHGLDQLLFIISNETRFKTKEISKSLLNYFLNLGISENDLPKQRGQLF
jgi:hypothetical protein